VRISDRGDATTLVSIVDAIDAVMFRCLVNHAHLHHIVSPFVAKGPGRFWKDPSLQWMANCGQRMIQRPCFLVKDADFASSQDAEVLKDPSTQLKQPMIFHSTYLLEVNGALSNFGRPHSVESSV